MTKRLLLAFLVSFTLIYISFIPRPLNSVAPTDVKDVLSSSQLSYFARLGAGNSAADTQLNIALTANPSNTTNNLFVGDTIGIGNTNGGTTSPLTIYSIRDIASTAVFQINTGLGDSNTFTGASVIATRSAIHTVYFTPKSSITGGAWQFLLKASSRTGESQQDGIPDQQGFDFGQDVGSTTTGSGTRLKTADISCPFGSASVGTTVVVSSNSYHIIECDLGAGVTNPVDVGVTMLVGRALTTGSQLINPAPALSHTEGQADSTADVYYFQIRHLDGSDAVIAADTITGRIAVVESVRITATIDPTITFIIDNTNVVASDTRCGVVLGSAADNTTAVSAAFGSLSLGAFNDLAHRLSCVTNATGGYIITVYEIDQMKNISTATTLPDTNCDGACSASSDAVWDTDTTNSGWGYSLEDVSVGTTIFNWNRNAGTGVSFSAKAFGEGSANAQTIMSNTSTPTAIERAYICYRLTAATSQEAGSYENQIVYTATATF